MCSIGLCRLLLFRRVCTLRCWRGSTVCRQYGLWRRSGQRSAASFPMRCCARFPAFPKTSSKPRSPASSLRSWCFREASRPTRFTASSTRWCRTQRVAACCVALDSSCTRRSQKRSKPNHRSSWTPNPSSSPSITRRRGSLKNPSRPGVRPAGDPPLARRWRKRTGPAGAAGEHC
jgi:hypothetical protein